MWAHSASISSICAASEIALRSPGRFSVAVTTAPSRATSRNGAGSAAMSNAVFRSAIFAPLIVPAI